MNLVVEAASQRDALLKLQALMEAYVFDAVEQNEIDQFIPRRAPISFYVEYWTFRLISWLNGQSF